MATNRIIFSFFRYPVRHAPGAFLLMGFKGLFGHGLPAGAVRLMGCGSADGFSVVPDFTRYCLTAALDRPGDLKRLRDSRLYRIVAGPSLEQIHFMLRPASGHGTWDGKEPFAYSGARVGERPFAVLTHARVDRPHMRRFWGSVPAIRRHLAESSGCAYHVGFGEHPFLTLATFSVWRDMEAMRAFAYRHSPHHDAARSSRSEHWHTESLFARFEIESVAGDLSGWPLLEGLAGSIDEAERLETRQAV